MVGLTWGPTGLATSMQMVISDVLKTQRPVNRLSSTGKMMSGKRCGVRNIKDACLSQEKKKGKIPDCELLSTCPFFNDMQATSEMTGVLKEQYCTGNYAWCGRYMVFKALERELERTSSFGLVA